MNLTKSKDFYASLVYFLISLALILLNLVWFLPTTRELRKNVTALELEVSMRAHSKIESFLEEKEEDLEITSRFLNRYNFRDPLNGIAVANILKDSYFNGAFLLDRQGQEVFRADRFKTVSPSELRDFSGAVEFKSVIGSGKMFFGEIRFSEKLEPMMTIAFPVFLREGEIAGVLGAELNVKTVFNEISDIRIGERGQIYVVDKNGILISHRDTSLVLKKTDYSSRKIIADIISSGKHELSVDDDTYLYTNEDGEKVLAVANRIEKTGWVAIFEEPRSEALKPIRDIQIFAGLVVLAGLVALLILRMINSRLAKSRGDLQTALEDSKEKRERLSAIISSMGEGLLLIDKDYRIVLLNSKAENLLGVSAGEVIGRDMKDVITVLKGSAVLNEEERPVVRMFKTGQTISVDVEDDFYYQSSSGRKFPVGLMITPLRGDGITGAVVIFRDISEEKRLDESKTNFISISSHQLRTPLTSIRWFSEMLLDGEAGAINKDQKDFIEKISQSAERMVNLVNLLLQIARVEMGRLKIEPEQADLKNTTQKITAFFKNIADSKSQKIEVKTNPVNIPLIPLDKEIIWQVIQNLVSNALRYSPAGGVVLISIILKNQFIEYSVKNNGIGVPENQKGRLFEKFFRATNAVKAVPEGSGLGLFLVKSLVEGWGGKIWFESEEGKGATFFFTIPLEGMKAEEGEVTLKV